MCESNSFSRAGICAEKQPPILVRIAQLVVFTTALFVLAHAVKNPTQNWDMLGYVASVISLEHDNPEEIHALVYHQFKDYADAESFAKLTDDNGYRETMLKDADAFYQQIPFYKIRILLILMIAGLVKLGINIYTASHLLSAVLTATAVVTFYYAFKQRIHPLLWLFLPVIVVLFNIHEFAQRVTADSLAFLWLGLMSYSFLHQNWKLFFVFLATSVWVRTDLIVLVALFSVYFLFFKPELRRCTLIAGFFAVIAYLAINQMVGNYGWSTVFYYAVISDMAATHPLEYDALGVSVNEYIAAVLSNIGMFFSGRELLLFEVSLITYFLLIAFREKSAELVAVDRFQVNHRAEYPVMNEPVFILVVISLLYVLIHYLLFPLVFERFFIGQFLLTTLGMFTIISAVQKDFVRGCRSIPSAIN